MVAATPHETGSRGLSLKRQPYPLPLLCRYTASLALRAAKQRSGARGGVSARGRANGESERNVRKRNAFPGFPLSAALPDTRPRRAAWRRRPLSLSLSLFGQLSLSVSLNVGRPPPNSGCPRSRLLGHSYLVSFVFRFRLSSSSPRCCHPSCVRNSRAKKKRRRRRAIWTQEVTRAD